MNLAVRKIFKMEFVVYDMSDVKRGIGFLGIYAFIIAAGILFIGSIVGLVYYLSPHCGEMRGDANGDGKIDNFDVKKIMDYSGEEGKVECFKNADFNSDGLVDTLDGRELTSYLLDRGRGGISGGLGGDSSGIFSPVGRSDLGKKPSERVSKIEEEESEKEACDTAVGDVNGDGFIDRKDFEEIINLIKGKGSVKCRANADFDNDGSISVEDKNYLREYIFGVDDSSLDDFCVDADNGASLGFKGRTVGLNDKRAFEKEDSCADDKTVIEFYCAGDRVREKSEECEVRCDSGKCVEGSEQQEPPPEDECKDAEGEVNEKLYGEVLLVKNGEVESFKDVCGDDAKTLVEYSCDGKEVKDEERNCANGCLDGRCINDEINCDNNPKGENGEISCDTGLECPSTVACDCQDECRDGLTCFNGRCTVLQQRGTENSCSDSDGGKNSGVKGVVSGVKNGITYSKTDSCKAGSISTLIEYSCNRDSFVEEEITCGYGGCVDGICVQGSGASCEDNPVGSCDSLECSTGQACQCNEECESGMCINSQCAESSSNQQQPSSSGFGGISCENNIALCQASALDCNLGNRCDCYGECSSGYCWGNSALNYVCQAGLAPDGSYSHSSANCRSGVLEGGRCVPCASIGSSVSGPSYCCSKAWENGKCVVAPSPESCLNNVAGCNSGLDCAFAESCDCNDECASGICVNGKCDSSGEGSVSSGWGDNSGAGSIPANSGGEDSVLNEYTTSPISCSNNPPTCDYELNCNSGIACNCRDECSSGKCWGLASSSMVCQSNCAPEGAYVYLGDSSVCCSGLSLDVNTKKCITLEV